MVAFGRPCSHPPVGPYDESQGNPLIFPPPVGPAVPIPPIPPPPPGPRTNAHPPPQPLAPLPPWSNVAVLPIYARTTAREVLVPTPARGPRRRRRGRRERCWRRPFGVSFCCASAPSRRPRCASPRAFCPTLAGRTAGRLAQDLAGPFRSPWDVLRPRNALQRRPVGRASGTRAASELREMTFCTSDPRLAAAAPVRVLYMVGARRHEASSIAAGRPARPGPRGVISQPLGRSATPECASAPSRR